MCITNRSLKKKFFPTCWMTFRVTESVTTPQNAINLNNCRWLAYVWAVQRQLRSGLSMNIYLNIHWFWTWLGMYMSVIVIESEKTANDCVTELPLFWRLVSTDFASNSTNVHMTRCSAERTTQRRRAWVAWHAQGGCPPGAPPSSSPPSCGGVSAQRRAGARQVVCNLDKYTVRNAYITQ